MIPLWFIFSRYQHITLFPLIQCVNEPTDSNSDTSDLYLEVAILAKIPNILIDFCGFLCFFQADTVTIPERRLPFTFLSIHYSQFYHSVLYSLSY